MGEKIKRKEKQKANPCHLTVLSLQKYFYPVEKLPRDNGIIQYPIFITRYIIQMEVCRQLPLDI
jgi:hypothetical protein